MNPEQQHHHEDVWRSRERYAPNPRVQDVLQRAHVPVARIVRHRAPFDEGAAVAAAFEAQPCLRDEPVAQHAYRQLVEQTDAWWRILHQACGVVVKATDATEPYATAKDQARDMRWGRLVVSTALSGNHPLLSQEEYWRFRAVHDAFGHAGIGRGFDRHGEYQAWLVHICMFKGFGGWAMSSEYRGVNSSLVYGKAMGTGKATLLSVPSVLPELNRLEI